jgi:hypothetical protein
MNGRENGIYKSGGEIFSQLAAAAVERVEGKRKKERKKERGRKRNDGIVNRLSWRE